MKKCCQGTANCLREAVGHVTCSIADTRTLSRGTLCNPDSILGIPIPPKTFYGLGDLPRAPDTDNRMLGPGGAPTRATSLPNDAQGRKDFPVASGVLDYFPDALVAISEVSKKGNDQHNPGLPLRWTRNKSTDESDTCMRHFLQRGTMDIDGIRHTAKAAWRMLAILQKEIEQSNG